MKLITAVVAPSRVGPIWRVLRLFDLLGMTVSDAYCVCGRRCLVEVVTADADAADVFRVIRRVSGPGDLVRVLRLDLFADIGTGQVGPDAL